MANTPKTRNAAPLFPLGQIVATPAALDALEYAEVLPDILIERHAAGDWGDVTPGDKAANDQALKDGSRLVSAYNLPTGARVGIITEWDRSATTILLADEN